jgi:uncharacterized phage protein (TIGR01671 family)
MREIKFRAWDNFFKQMYYFDFENNIEVRSGHLWIVHEEGAISSKSPSIKIMQYTGLKDRNDKEIYVGDLVAVVDYANWEGLYKIIWDEKNLMYMLEDAFGDREKLCEFEEYLVKGNIYENPELLEVESVG